MKKIVATSDTHFNRGLQDIPDGDILFHCGDLMLTGYLDEWYQRLDALRALPHETKILVPGNHDFHIDLYPGSAYNDLRNAGVHLMSPSYPVVVLEDVTVLGIPWVTNLPTWAFNRSEDDIEKWLDLATINEEIDIVLSHSPPYLILDAIDPDGRRVKDRRHVGGRALRRWFNNLENKPKMWFCGHIHESYGHAVVGGCEFFNVSRCDKDYEVVNPPIVLEL